LYLKPNWSLLNSEPADFVDSEKNDGMNTVLQHCVTSPLGSVRKLQSSILRMAFNIISSLANAKNFPENFKKQRINKKNKYIEKHEYLRYNFVPLQKNIDLLIVNFILHIYYNFT